jgi:hypothetical protein
MGEEAVWNLFDLAQGGDSVLKIPRVPKNDRGDDKVQSGGAMLLILVGSVADFTEPVRRSKPAKSRWWKSTAMKE